MASQAGFVEDVLSQITPAAVIEVDWARRLRVSAYLDVFEVPDELIVSVRCVVLVDGKVLVCEDAGGERDILPGGRREAGESYLDTACREIHEETGWRLDPATLEMIGLIHLHNLGEPLPPYPYPHGIHLVYRGTGIACAADNWTDIEGQILRSDLMTPDDALGTIAGDGLGRVFLGAAIC